MAKLKLMTILGTRPEIIRLSETIKCCDEYFDHILVHTGQNYDYELNEIFFQGLQLRRPDFYLECAGNNLGETMGSILEKSYNVMQKEKPDAILILGDTNSALSAISAKRLKIPVFHMEAGNRCWDWNVPEMINRKIVDHIADVNLPYTEHSRRYLLSEGLDGKMIFVTGSPMREVIEKHRTAIEESNVLEELALKPQQYFILSAHREENIDNEKNFLSLMHAVNKIAESYSLPVIYSTHPRSKKRIEERGFVFHSLVKSMKPFGFHDYCRLQMNAACVLSDSGTLSEESAMLGFPAVLIRTSTERPEAVDAGSITIGGVTEDSILQALNLSMSMKRGNRSMPLADGYENINVSERVVRIIQSYTDIINRVVWRKDVN